MTFRPVHFVLQELVAPEIFQARGERAWELLDPYAVLTLDQLRIHFGPLTVNDWLWGGRFKYSGLRPVPPTVGTIWSQHCYGRAFDPKPVNVTPQEMHAEILKAPERFPYLRVLESIAATPTWVHFDVRFHTRDGIWIVNP